MVRSKSFQIKRVSPSDSHFFFGYYGICPWNKEEDKILACHPLFIERHPEKDDLLKIGFIKEDKFHELAETRAWSWQQGCMLQWIPKKKDSIIFNDRKDNKFISRALNIRTKKEISLPLPIYCLHPGGKYALSLSFSRLDDIRKGYGYAGSSDKFSNEMAPANEGIYLLDLNSKKFKLIISLAQLRDILPQESMNSGKHWVDHLSFNQEGTRFCFFHRWEISEEMFNTRLVTSDLAGKDIRILGEGGHYSHVTWINNTELLGWGSSSKLVSKIKSNSKKSNFFFNTLRPIYRRLIPKVLRNRLSSQSYLLFNDKTGESKKISLFNQDGHPTISPDKKNIVTDTYADSKHFRQLILLNTESKNRAILGKFYSLPKKEFYKDLEWDNSGMRCDLHPRWNNDGTKVCFDSVHEGYRGIYEVNIR